MVVADMPFGSYQASPAQALDNAARFLKDGGAQAVKLEGGERVVPGRSPRWSTPACRSWRTWG